MAKVCIMGDYDSICGFSAIGIDIFPETDGDKAATTVENLIKNDYVIILITENLAVKIKDILDKYRTLPTPAIIPVPSSKGTEGLGMGYLKKAVEQAVGSADMIFGEEVK